MLHVDISSDGVNPAIYTIPAGVTLTITDWGDSGHTLTLEGPFEGELPERTDDDEDE